MINDAHVHFFSPGFFDVLGAQQAAQEGRSDAPYLSGHVVSALGWDDPVSPEALADRWAAECDRHGVSRASLIASVPGDFTSVASAVARHPLRFVGCFMLDPTRDSALAEASRALDAGLRTICLFPAMHGYAAHDPRVHGVFELASSFRPPSLAVEVPASGQPGRPCVFVHCGVLSVGVRKKLGLPSRFDMRFGNPLDLHGVALRFGSVPIIVPHFGAGLLREALMLADLCPNVHLDTSSSNAWVNYSPGLTLEAVFDSALRVVGPDRLLFGTDSSFFPRGWNREVYERQKVALDAIGANAEIQAAIFGGNFDRLFPQGIGQ